MNNLRRPGLLLLCTMLGADVATAQERAASAPPAQDGSAASRFGADAGAMALRWRADLGSGYSGVAVAASRAVTMFADDPQRRPRGL